jgi:hypothetical protein
MVILRCYSFVTGGRNGVKWVASLLWNQWPEWSRMGGRNGVEYACGMRIGLIMMVYSTNYGVLLVSKRERIYFTLYKFYHKRWSKERENCWIKSVMLFA